MFTTGINECKLIKVEKKKGANYDSLCLEFSQGNSTEGLSELELIESGEITNSASNYKANLFNFKVQNKSWDGKDLSAEEQKKKVVEDIAKFNNTLKQLIVACNENPASWGGVVQAFKGTAAEKDTMNLVNDVVLMQIFNNFIDMFIAIAPKLYNAPLRMFLIAKNNKDKGSSFLNLRTFNAIDSQKGNSIFESISVNPTKLSFTKFEIDKGYDKKMDVTKKDADAPTESKDSGITEAMPF